MVRPRNVIEVIVYFVFVRTIERKRSKDNFKDQLRYLLHCSNYLMLSNIKSFIQFQDELIKEVHDMIEMDEDGVDTKFKQLFEYVQHGKIPIFSS